MSRTYGSPTAGDLSPWSEVADGCTNIQVTPTRIGILSSGNGGTLFIRDGAVNQGLNAGFVSPPSSDHIVQFALDGSRIGATSSNNYCWARDSLSGPWSQLAAYCTNVQLKDNRIGVLSTGDNGTVFYRDGIGSTGWIKPTNADGSQVPNNVSTFNLSSIITTTTTPDTSQTLAQQILGNKNISLLTKEVSGVSDGADAYSNIRDVSNGLQAKRSSYSCTEGTAPGGTTTLSVNMLSGMQNIGRTLTIRVTEIAGGCHTNGSAHYYGKAFDVDVINGQQVSKTSNYNLLVQACYANGAAQVLKPGDPGHDTNVHCGWN
jgi:hypothetical protein